MMSAGWEHLCRSACNLWREIKVVAMQSNDILRLIAHVVCLIVIRSLTSALQPMEELKAPLSGTKVGFL